MLQYLFAVKDAGEAALAFLHKGICVVSAQLGDCFMLKSTGAYTACILSEAEEHASACHCLPASGSANSMLKQQPHPWCSRDLSRWLCRRHA